MIEGMTALYIFMLSAFTGYEVISRVPVILHTPLMSGSNAISGITIVGAIMCALAFREESADQLAAAGQAIPGWFANTLAFLAIMFATINVVGGFLVTGRMLKMFRKR